MKRLLLGLLTIAVVLLQVAWLPLVRPFGVVPSLVLVLAVLVALDGTVLVGLTVAVSAGLALDVVSGGMFGIWTGTLVLEVLVAAMIRQAGIESDGFLVPAVMVVAGTLTVAILILSGLAGTIATWPLGALSLRMILEILLNLGLIVALRPLVRRCVTPEAGGRHG